MPYSTHAIRSFCGCYTVAAFQCNQCNTSLQNAAPDPKFGFDEAQIQELRQHRIAGVGQIGQQVWLCDDCRRDLCSKRPRMPKYSLANFNFIGRMPPLYQGFVGSRVTFEGERFPTKAKATRSGSSCFFRTPWPVHGRSLVTASDGLKCHSYGGTCANGSLQVACKANG